MLKILGLSVALFATVTFTDAIAEGTLQGAIDMSEDTAWMHDEFWMDPALHTGKPILKPSTASVPVRYDEAKVIAAQEYLRAVSDEIDANLLWADAADFERNQF